MKVTAAKTTREGRLEPAFGNEVRNVAPAL